MENLTDDVFDDLIDDLKKCEVCGEYVNEDELIDTEGCINGGIGLVCEDCYENCDVGGCL